MSSMTVIKLVRLLEKRAEEVAEYIAGCVNGFYDQYDGKVDMIPKHEVFSDIAVMDGFDPDIDYREQPNKKSLTGRKGIYVFILKEDASLTSPVVSVWNGRYNGGLKGRGAAIEDSKRAGDMKKGQCFYVGSVSSKNVSIQTRMKQHYDNKESATSGLKLNHPERTMMKDKLQVLLFPVKKEYVEVGRVFIPIVEKKLHEKLKPVAGNCR